MIPPRATVRVDRVLPLECAMCAVLPPRGRGAVDGTIEGGGRGPGRDISGKGF